MYSMPDAHYFNDEWFTVVECTSCGLGFVNPRPAYSEMSKYYPAAYYEGFAEDREYQKRRYRIEAGYVQGSVAGSDDKLLLDVGCANGDFPRHMRRLCWQVEGVELSANARQISDFKVYRQEVTRIPVNEPRYDAITAWAVLKHVHDPMAYFEKVSTLLKPGGAFVFLVTNFDSLSSRCLFREDVPRHLYFFTEETIKRYLSPLGLELVGARYDDKIYKMSPSNRLYYYVYRYIKERKLEWKNIPLNRTEYFKRHGLHNNLGSNLRYAFSNPFAALDRALMPAFERYKLLSNKYGIVTYTAVKR